MSLLHRGPKMINPLFNSKKTINPVVIDSKFLGFSIPKKWCKDIPEHYLPVDSPYIYGLYDNENSEIIKIPSEISEFDPSNLTFNIQRTRELLESMEVIRETTYKILSPRFTTRVISNHSFYARPGKREVEVGIFLNQNERKGIPKNLISKEEGWSNKQEEMLIIKIPYTFYDLLDTYIEDYQGLILGFITKYRLEFIF